MANKERGEHVVELGGKKYPVRVDYNVFAELEDRHAISIFNYKTEDMRLKHMLTMLHLGLKNADPELELSERDIGSMITPANMQKVVGQILQAFRVPDAEEMEKNEGEKEKPAKESKAGLDSFKQPIAPG